MQRWRLRHRRDGHGLRGTTPAGQPAAHRCHRGVRAPRSGRDLRRAGTAGRWHRAASCDARRYRTACRRRTASPVSSPRASASLAGALAPPATPFSEVVSTWRSTISAALRSGVAVADEADPDASEASRNSPELWNACLMSSAGQVLIEAGRCASTCATACCTCGGRLSEDGGDAEIGEQRRQARPAGSPRSAPPPRPPTASCGVS